MFMAHGMIRADLEQQEQQPRNRAQPLSTENQVRTLLSQWKIFRR